MKKVFTVVLLYICSVNCYAEKYTSEIKSLPNEKWYGAYTAKAFCNTPLKDLTFQPYLPTEKRKDLTIDNRGNQVVPLLISNMGRYVWSNDPFAFEFKDGDLIIYSDVEKVQALIAGKTLRDAYVGAKNIHFPASGKTPHPLLFQRPQYNTWIELNYDQRQDKVLKYTDDIIENKFPTGVFMIDENWAKAFGMYEFDGNAFPEPKKMVDDLHAQGFKVMLWVCPFISADSKVYNKLAKVNLLVLNKDSKKPAMIKWWEGYSACLDLTKPQAIDWLRQQLINLQKTYGIDGFKFDAGDFDFYSSGSRIFPNEPTNTTGPIQAEAYGKFGAEFELNEFRAAFKNSNQPLAQRLQDKRYSWDDLKLLVPDMISAGLIGHPFSCPDMIGGGLLGDFINIDYTKFDQELMIRSAQIQALMPMMQFSVAPWRVLDKKHLNLCREAALLHTKMGDYIFSLAQKAAKDGEPIIRHLEYSFPNQGFESCDDQFMLGEKYLVAPMIVKGTSREVKLPTGNWVDDLGKKYKGGQTVKMDVPLNRLVYFTLQK